MLQFLHPAFQVPDSAKAYKNKIIHRNNKQFVKVIDLDYGFKPIGCNIRRAHVAREELPKSRLEWRGRRLDAAAEDAPDGNNKAVEEDTGGGNNNE